MEPRLQLKTFVALNALRGMESMAELRVALPRLLAYLTLPERTQLLRNATPMRESAVATPGDAVLTLCDLACEWISDRRVLRNVSFSLAPGELLAVLGPVGCGSLLQPLLQSKQLGGAMDDMPGMVCEG